ncbi:MAG: phosphohydrolase [Planctomycetota bacterium]|nr:MAG: phosphohydrolase [Planctomycetota bacterium]
MVLAPDMQKAVDTLRPLSSAAQRLIALLGNEEYEIEDVIQIVELDTTLTARLLSFVNSASFGVGVEISSIRDAVRFAGDKVVLGLALQICGSEVFGHELRAYACSEEALWRHSLLVAIAARNIAKRYLSNELAGVAYTAGMLHDIGKAVIVSWLPTTPSEVLAARPLDATSFTDLEQELVGTDHSELGAAMAKHWSLPRNLLNCIQFHHNPKHAPADLQPLVYAIHLADFLAMMSGVGTGLDDMQYSMDSGCYDFIDISPSEVDEIVFSATEEHRRLLGSFKKV